MLEIRNLGVKLGGKAIITDVSLELNPHDILMIVGPNGAGKSTLIRAVMQLYPYTGRVLLDGEDLSRLKPRQLAARMGVLAQRHQLQFPQTVREVVRLGRYAHQKSLFNTLDGADLGKIEAALERTGLTSLAHRSVLTLSGGELQRVFLAQLLAQDPDILILDEPTNHLDLKYQIAMFDIVKEWSRADGKAVIAVVHDLNTVFAYGTRAVLMDKGRVFASGDVDQVLTPDNLNEVYQVNVAHWMKNLMEHWG